MHNPTTRHLVAAVVISVFILDGAVAIAQSPSAGSADAGAPGGVILFGRYDAGVERYSMVTADGSDQRQVFEAEGCAPCVYLSPDGDRIMRPAVTSDDRLTTAVMDADGTNESFVPLPSGTLNLGPGAWSPDGSRLALSGFDETNPSGGGIYTVDSTGLSDIVRVTGSEDGRLHEPIAWSPEGERILYFVESGPVGPVTHAGDLFVVNSDGSDMRQLDTDELDIGRVSIAGSPASWSPDGLGVAFGGFDVDAADGRSAVFVVDATGGEPRRLTEWGQSIAGAIWSPTGEWIASGSLREPSVILIDPNTDKILTLASSADQACCPTWSPDGTHLLLQRGPEGARHLTIIDLAGEVTGQVTQEPGEYFFSYAWAAG